MSSLAATSEDNTRASECGREQSDPTLVQFPEITCKTEVAEQGLRFFHCPAAPPRVAAVVVPLTRQGPASCRRESRAACKIPTAAPAVHHLFRPEEEHGLSIKNDIFPPSPRRNGEVDNTLAS